MTNQDSNTSAGLNRRRMLKGTAVAGLAGSALTGTASATEKIITIRGTGAPAEYRFEVSGEVLSQVDGGPGGEDRAVDDGSAAVGRVAGRSSDEFRFTGELVSFEYSGRKPEVFVNGDRVEIGELSNTITIRGEGETVEYKFRVSGRVEKGDFANESDRIDGNVVRGVVGAGKDSFRYSGAITFEEADGPLTVTLDIDQ